MMRFPDPKDTSSHTIGTESCTRFQGVHFSLQQVELDQIKLKSDKPKMFKGLQIKYVRGSDPVLKLLDDNGNIAEELSILKWNTDSVEEFLSEKLDRV
ncbi:SEP15 protein, partial [Polyodon spathula]|nr:SEP15 protein [Polyodon spathula]